MGRLLFQLHYSLTLDLFVEQILHLVKDLLLFFLQAYLTFEELAVDKLFVGESGVLGLSQTSLLFLVSLLFFDSVEAEAWDLNRIVFQRTFVLDHDSVCILDAIDEFSQGDSLYATIAYICQS